MAWGGDYENGVIEYIKEIEEYALLHRHLSFETQHVSRAYFDFIFSTPDKKLAEVSGDILHDYCDVGIKYAPKMSILDALIYFFTRKSKTNNIKFSAARSSKLAQKIIKHSPKNILQTLFDARINRSKNIAKITIFGIKISFRSLIYGKGHK